MTAWPGRTRAAARNSSPAPAATEAAVPTSTSSSCSTSPGPRAANGQPFSHDNALSKNPLAHSPTRFTVQVSVFIRL